MYLPGAEVGKEVMILDESAFVEGLALSEMLAKRGSKVELVTRDPAPGLETLWSLQLPYLYERAFGAGVTFTPNASSARSAPTLSPCSTSTRENERPDEAPSP